MSPQHVRFCNSFDGATIAYAVSGEGPPVVMLPSWLTHLERQWHPVAWRPWLEALSTRYRLIRYDPRGCGLSERDVDDLSFESWVQDCNAVVEAVEDLALQRVAIEDLEHVYHARNRAALSSRLSHGDAMHCSLVYEALKQRAFDGDVERMLEWSRTTSSAANEE